MNFRDSLDTIELAETDHYNLSHFLESGAVDCTGEVSGTSDPAKINSG